MEHHRAFEHVFAIDANDETRRPRLTGGQRNRSTDEAQTDDADALKDRRLPGTTPGLQHRQLLPLRHLDSS
jgi:hypothetical protein